VNQVSQVNQVIPLIPVIPCSKIPAKASFSTPIGADPISTLPGVAKQSRVYAILNQIFIQF
jgi:hypothetical protein